LCESVLVGFVCMTYEKKTVFAAAALTAAMVMGLTAYACTQKDDFTESLCGLYLVAVLVLCIIASIPLYLFCGVVIPRLVVCLLGVVIFSIYIIWDTRIIVGGNNRFGAFEHDDFIIASMILYIDIIQLFLYILQATQGGHAKCDSLPIDVDRMILRMMANQACLISSSAPSCSRWTYEAPFRTQDFDAQVKGA